MGKASRDKGARRELQVVHLHTAMGVKSERVPLSGAVKFRNTRQTDVDVYPLGADREPWVTEVKARGDGAGFTTIKRWLSDADALFLIEDRVMPLVVLPWARWADLLRALQPGGRISPELMLMLDEAAEAAELDAAP